MLVLTWIKHLPCDRQCSNSFTALFYWIFTLLRDKTEKNVLEPGNRILLMKGTVFWKAATFLPFICPVGCPFPVGGSLALPVSSAELNILSELASPGLCCTVQGCSPISKLTFSCFSAVGSSCFLQRRSATLSPQSLLHYVVCSPQPFEGSILSFENVRMGKERKRLSVLFQYATLSVWFITNSDGKLTQTGPSKKKKRRGIDWLVHVSEKPRIFSFRSGWIQGFR